MPSGTLTYQEGASAVIFVTEAPSQTFYSWQVTGGTATYGQDYVFSVPQNGSITNPPLGYQFTVNFLTDTVSDNNEYFDIVVNELDGGEFAVYSYRVFITEPAKASSITFGSSPIIVDEGSSAPVALFWSGFSQPFTYTISTVDGLAIANEDFKPIVRVATGNGDGFDLFSIQTIDDKLEEDDQSFVVKAVATTGASAQVTVTIRDNERLKCILDIDGDGVADDVEIKYSDALNRAQATLNTINQLRIQEDLVLARLEALKTEQRNIQIESGLQLTSYLAGILTLGTSSAAANWINALAPAAQALATLTAIGNNSDARDNAMRAMGNVVDLVMQSPGKFVPVASLLDQSIEQFKNAAFNYSDMDMLIRELRNLKDRQAEIDTAQQKAAKTASDLFNCLVKAAAAAETEVVYAPSEITSAAAPGDQGATSISSLDTPLLPAGMKITQGSAAADKVDVAAALAGGSHMALLGAGDDELKSRGGSTYVDGEAGRDFVHLIDANGEYAARASVQVASLLSSGPDDVQVGFKSGMFVGARSVELFLLSDGFLALTGGQLVNRAYDTRISAAKQNLLRIVTPIEKADLAAQSLLTNTNAGWQDFLGQTIKEAAKSTSVATLSYQFFTGKIPSAAGMDFLVSPTGPNSNNLNSSYYQSFNLENRYINFAVNLGKLGEGKDNFTNQYGSLSLIEATKKAYTTIFGVAPTDEKVHALVDPRADYFAYYGQDGANGIGTKAAMVGWLLAEAVKADVGMLPKANDAFLTDLADGATFAVDLVGVYGKPEFALIG